LRRSSLNFRIISSILTSFLVIYLTKPDIESVLPSLTVYIHAERGETSRRFDGGGLKDQERTCGTLVGEGLIARRS
jgi:hypothetical protein